MRSSTPVRAERVARALAAILLIVPRLAAADAEDPFSAPNERPTAPADALPPVAKTPRSSAGYRHWLGGAYLGRGLRFNNPYRLRRVLGDDAR